MSAAFSAVAQYEPLARNAFMLQHVQDAFDYWSISRPSYNFHSSFRPYLSASYARATDSLVPFRAQPFRNFFFAQTFNEAPQKRNWYQVQLHPIADYEAGYDMLLARTRTAATGGMHFKASVNNDFVLAFTAYASRSAFPFFLDTSISRSRIVPWAGQAYRRDGAYDYSDFQGYVSWSPGASRIFNLQAGRDKHFVGDGYRSLLLSDYAAAYPYFRINANIWHIQYHAWYTWMSDVTNANGVKSNFRDKYGTFHYLSWNILPQLNVSFFENVIWRGSDTNQARGFDASYLNPVIFFRPVEYANGSPDNSFIGANISGILWKKLKLYGQLALDEFFLKEIRARSGWWANKQGWQLGMKTVNAFGVRGLKLQAEYNEVRPYTYTHGLVDQNYSHYGMPLAHPFGANFREMLGIASYRKNRTEVTWQGMYAVIGKDSLSPKSNVGQNIFLSYTTRPFEYGHHTTQGVRTTLLQSHAKIVWHILPAMCARLELGYIQRAESSQSGYAIQNPYIYVAFRTSFWNTYQDF